jgi:hypothetical protein
MNLIGQAGSIRPNAHGWRELSRFADPVFQPARAASFQLISGAGKQANFLSECFQSLVFSEREIGRGLGWQPPPAARIHVALAGRGDPDWSLEPDETKF